MQNQKPRDTGYIIRLTVILLFFSLLIFPLALMALDGPDETEMESESVTAVEDFSINGYLRGTFQTAFSKWFSAHYPLRSSIVTKYRSARYSLENSAFLVNSFALLTGQTTQADPTPVVPTLIPTIIPTDTPDNPDPDNPDNPDVTDTPVNPWAKYLSADNIYAEINQKQLMQAIVEPTGYRGNNAVYIGKSGYLFERAYMDEYLGYTAPYNTVTLDGLKKTVEELEYIQTELAKRGITMLYVISSSKASQYADYIPDWYKNMNTAPEGYVRPIDQLRPLLAASSINYLDSSVYYQEIGLLVTFPKTGIHWNLLASGESTAKLMRMYTEITGNEIKQLSITGYRSQASAINFGNSEVDVYNILYGAAPEAKAQSIVDSAYYAPVIEVENSSAPKVNVLIQGGSFTSDIVSFLSHYQVADVTRIYYNDTGTFQSSGSGNIWDDTIAEDGWEYWLKDRDIVIFEATEQQIRSEHYSGGSWLNAANTLGHNAVYDSLYAYLKKNEGKY